MPFTSLRVFLAKRGGAASFRDFMESALYEPATGYYSSRIREVGARGDFSTSASLGSALGRAIASWARDEIAELPQLRGADGKVHLIEMGPGTGALALTVIKSFAFFQRRKIHLHLVDRSPGLVARQKEVLANHRNVSWHREPAEALEAAGGRAILFSNELVDAFPVDLWEWDGVSWQEVWLETDAEGRLVEALRPIQEKLESSILAHFAAQRAQPGQRVEIHESYRQWLGSWCHLIKMASMLTIDYGGLASKIYARRPHGTLRSYLIHQRREGPGIYENMGRQDITADVNFTDLKNWSEHLGFRTVALTSQAEFLQGHTKLANLTDSRLGSMGDAGEAFQVLAQRWGAG